MKIPKRINPCPIIEAIVEIRFEANIPPDAVFGVIYNEYPEEILDAEEAKNIRVIGRVFWYSVLL